MNTSVIIYGTIASLIVALGFIAYFVAKYQAKVNESNLNDLYSKIDHTKNYK